MENKTNQPIKRVRCVVDSCHFWANGDNCTAQEIEIQPQGAMNSEMTDCATFIPESGMF